MQLADFFVAKLLGKRNSLDELASLDSELASSLDFLKRCAAPAARASCTRRPHAPAACTGFTRQLRAGLSHSRGSSHQAVRCARDTHGAHARHAFMARPIAATARGVVLRAARPSGNRHVVRVTIKRG